MLTIIRRRVGEAIVTLFLMSIVVFVLTRVTGDPVALLAADAVSQEDIQRIRQIYGLDRPLPIQYLSYMGDVLRGDLGTSLRAGTPVAELIRARLPNTVRLAGLAALLSTVIAIPLGIIAAINRGKRIDRFAQVIAAFGQSTPNFWLAIMLVIIFSLHFGWLPVSGAGGPRHYVLPVMTLATSGVPHVMRMLRSSMLEVLASDYITVARAKGLRERVVIVRHSLKNALMPVVSILGILVANLISGSIVVENVFAWPGIGTLAQSAILWRDVPLMQGLLLGTILAVIVINLFVDILYRYLDPRIQDA